MTAESIHRLRELFNAELLDNSALYHSIDIERVQTEDWQIKRFLREQPDESKAFAALCKALQFKKSFGVHDRTDQYFPREFWELNRSELFGTDKEGHVISWSNVKHTKFIKEINQQVKQFIVHVLERADRVAGEAGCICVVDTRHAPLFTRDVEMEKFQYELIDYYPGLTVSMYIISSIGEMSWILQAIMKLMLNFAPAKIRQLLKFVSTEELREMIDLDLIPVNFNGPREVVHYPPNLQSFEECCTEMGLDQSAVELFYRTYNLNFQKTDENGNEVGKE